MGATDVTAIIEGLRNAPADEDDYTVYLEDLLREASLVEEPGELFSCAFQFFEEHPDADLGSPGPLAHYLERFYPAYTDALCDSAARRPTFYTLWMVNRILNAQAAGATRDRLLALLRAVADDSAFDEETRNEARQYLEYQLGNEQHEDAC